MNSIFGQYIPYKEIKRILASVNNPAARAGLFADMCRLNVLYMIQKAGSGHIGTSFSCLDILSWLHLEEISEGGDCTKDIFFSSKGHDVPALYSVLMGLGRLPAEQIHLLRRLEGLPGHPDIRTPNIVTNTGSLGMGISKAKGMAHAARLDGKPLRVFVLLGDGELQEGQIYESLQSSVNHSFGEITAIVDHNKIQSDTWIRDVSGLGDIEAKFKAFGWETARCDGHDFEALKAVFTKFRSIHNKPKILIADTVKGKGVSFMENYDAEKENGRYKYHSGALAFEAYSLAMAELLEGIGKGCAKEGISAPVLDTVTLNLAVLPSGAQRLVSAYGDELLKLSREHEQIVALDADLALDCGLIPFRQAYPERFIECGIAEQDMVSMAGGLALSGKLPVVHSFACFLSTRPNEQIYNNATERTKIIYTGSLAGVLPGGPGHSHQSVRDISLLGSIPGMTLIQPCNEKETRLALRWAVHENTRSSYIRLVSLPCVIPYELPGEYELELGKGVVIRNGRDGILLSYGPIMLTQAVEAANLLEEKGFNLKIVNLPWLNTVDSSWLLETVSGHDLVFTLDDHYSRFGQGVMLGNALAMQGICTKLINLGLKDIPPCGLNDEVLDSTGLAGRRIADKILLTKPKAKKKP